MMDREKVFKGLEAHGAGKSMWILCGKCPYNNEGEPPEEMHRCTQHLMCDAYALIKEQKKDIEKAAEILEKWVST